MSITWGVDGHGKQWPWCECCGEQFGQIESYMVEHECKSSSSDKVLPRVIKQPSNKKTSLCVDETPQNQLVVK